MKTSSKLLFSTLAALAFSVASSQAQWTYYDAVDFSNHPDAPGAENTWLDPVVDVPWITATGNGTPEWRFRNTGPGAPAYGTSAFAARKNESDPAVYTRVTGLTPDTEYTVRLYGVWTTRNNTWGLSYSLDNGNTWSMSIDRDTINENIVLGGGNWVDVSDNGVGAPVADPDSDTRAYVIIGSAMSDSAGIMNVGVQGWPNTSTERGVYDGIALAVGVVPEPTSFALVGLGAAALMIFRRRR